MKFNKALILIIAVGLSLRLLYFRNSLTFFYDQARDALMSMEIWQGDPIKILGPQAEFPGLHHGPLYWYLISPVYYLTHGSVWTVRLFLIFLNLATILFIYDLTKELFKNKKIALLASFLFSISFEAVQYARWLSNPAPVVLTSVISFWSLYKLIQGKGWALITLLISWGLSVQFQLFMIYQIFVFTIIWISLVGFKLPRVSRKIFIYSVTGLLFTLSTYIASELKFNFQGSKTLLQFFKTQTLFGESFVKLIDSYFDRLVNVFYLNIWGANLFLAGLMTIFTAYFSFIYIKKKKYIKEILLLIFWIVSPIIINFFSGPNANYITLGTLSGVIILTSYLLYKLKEKQAFLFVLALIIIIIGNLNLILSKNKEGEILFTVQKQMILGDELKIIDWIYRESEGKPFKLNTITAPLFINSTWAHLFYWYGRREYGYMPIWWGETQVDVPGSNIKFESDASANLHFVIIEPGASGDDNYVKTVKILENQRSEIIKRENIGFFTVEKRKITDNERIFTSADVFYTIKNTDLKIIQGVE